MQNIGSEYWDQVAGIFVEFWKMANMVCLGVIVNAECHWWHLIVALAVSSE